MKNKLKILIVSTLVVGLAGGYLYASKAEPAVQASAKDTNVECQYPFRPLTPEGRCDNSDPAIPQCLKAGDKEVECGQSVTECMVGKPQDEATQTACIERYFNPVIETPAPVETPAQPTPAPQTGCYGK